MGTPAPTDGPRSFTDDEIREIVNTITANVDKIASAVDALLPAMTKMSDSNVQLSSSNEKLASRNRHQRVVIGVLTALVVGQAFLGYRFHTQAGCFANWANRSTNRSDVLSPITKDIFFDLGTTLDDLAPPIDKVKLTADAILLSSDLKDYRVAYLANPVPSSPKLECPAF